ncbi:DUF2190 family protein [bacterium]|nr:DUF2190 family protein [bacterium]
MGKTYITNLVCSVDAASDTASNLFIGLDGAVCGAGKAALGVSIDSAKAGEGLPVAMNGILVVKAGGSITAGDAVVSDANGKAVSGTALTVAAPTVAAPTVALAAGAVAVTSDAATPTVNVTAGEVTAGEVSGGVLPQVVLGYALESASEGDLLKIRLV